MPGRARRRARCACACSARRTSTLAELPALAAGERSTPPSCSTSTTRCSFRAGKTPRIDDPSGAPMTAQARRPASTRRPLRRREALPGHSRLRALRRQREADRQGARAAGEARRRSSTSPATARTAPRPGKEKAARRDDRERAQLPDQRATRMAGVRIHDYTHPHWKKDVDILVGGAGKVLAYITLPKSTSRGAGGRDDRLHPARSRAKNEAEARDPGPRADRDPRRAARRVGHRRARRACRCSTSASWIS